MPGINLRVSVPICSFRKSYAREYLETERIPPPATVYGFLLSLVGEEDRSKYVGTRLAVAITSPYPPLPSTVLRTVWRIKSASPPGLVNNRRPDYQELLTDIELGVWVSTGQLSERLIRAMNDPASIERFGGLSLGESRDLVNEVECNPDWEARIGTWLSVDPHGSNPLPIWVDHVGSKGTKWQQFAIIKSVLSEPPDPDQRWITISPV